MAACDDLAARRGLDPAEIAVRSVESRVWPDTCLGLPAPELCAPGETPGFEVVLVVGEREHRYHTDTTTTVRYAEPEDVSR